MIPMMLQYFISATPTSSYFQACVLRPGLTSFWLLNSSLQMLVASATSCPGAQSTASWRVMFVAPGTAVAATRVHVGLYMRPCMSIWPEEETCVHAMVWSGYTVSITEG